MRQLLIIIALCPLVHGQTFKTTLEQVAVPITIHRVPGNPAVDFGPEDFRVFDSGRSVPIVSFGKVRQSIHVLLLLDTSRSMIETLSQVRSAAVKVIAQLEPHDSIQVGTFSSVLRLRRQRIKTRDLGTYQTAVVSGPPTSMARTRKVESAAL